MYQKELPVVLQKDITSLFEYSLPLFAVMAYPHTRAWYESHYIGMIGKHSQDKSVWCWLYDALDLFDSNDDVNEIFEPVKFGRKAMSGDFEIIGFMKEVLDQERYMIIFLDEYYLDVSRKYQTEHFIHEFLIYGLDEEAGYIMGMGFDGKLNYNMLKFDLSQILMAHKAAVAHKGDYDMIIEKKCIITFRIPDNIPGPELGSEEYKQVIAKKLWDYFESRCSKNDKPYLHRTLKEVECLKSGLSCDELLVTCLEHFIEDEDYTIEVRLLFLLAELKKAVFRSLKWIVTDKDVLDDYQQFVREYDLIRMSFIKLAYQYGKQGFTLYRSVFDNLPKIEQTIETVKLLNAREKEILGRALAPYPEYK